MGYLIEFVNDKWKLSDGYSILGTRIIEEIKKSEKIDKNLLRYLTVKVKKHDLQTNYFKKNIKSENDLKYTLELISKYKIINQCYKKAEYFINLALNSLSIFQDSKEKQILKKLTSFSLERNF